MAAFNAAVSGPTTYDFNSIVLPLPPNNYSIGPTTVGGVTFDTLANTNNIPFLIGANYYANTLGGVAFFSGQSTTAGQPNADLSYVTATLAGVTGIGFYYSPGDDAEGAITVTLNGVIYNLAIPTFNTTEFVGFTSDTPITSLTFAEQGYGMDITKFTTGSATSSAPVPEPATLLLLGSGLLGLTGFRKKLKK